MQTKKEKPFLLLCTLLLLATECMHGNTRPDLLTQIGAVASEGAVSGYVADKACATCHKQHYAGFQNVGMAQSFKRPGTASAIENFGVEYFHAESQRYYRMIQQGDELTFRRYQRDMDGAPINLIDIPVTWVIGSGNRARSYIHATERGEMILLPISWYSQAGQWRMSPGFEHAGHQGVNRRIKRKCMFCHNAFPEVSVGSDSHWAPEIFPADLPEGIGCQRCHGPGADHIRSALKGSTIEAIRAGIVNPANFSGDQLDSVCFQCHMLPSARLVGASRIDRPDYSFRPGELLTDYLVHVDVVERDDSTDVRFEINHHAYRFIQSACYLESDHALSCISCHDPHVKPESAAFRKKSSGVCLNCHSKLREVHGATTAFEPDDCIGCHMPTRRTGDVIEVTMTDHRIARGPFDLAALVAPANFQPAPISGVKVLNFGDPPQGDKADMYRMMAALRANRFVDAARQSLQKHLQQQEYDSPVPYIDLARAQIQTGDYKGAETTARRLILKNEKVSVAYTILGMSLMAQNQPGAAKGLFIKSLELQEDPETRFNLAAAHLQIGEIDKAEQQIERALSIRPLMAIAWKYKGIILKSRNNYGQAKSALVRALQIEPRDATVYRELIQVLRHISDNEEAERYLELGRRVSNNPALLQAFD